MAAGARPASGSGAGFLQRTASGSALGPGPTHTGRSEPGSRHLDADLGDTDERVSEGEPVKATRVILLLVIFRICVILKRVGTFIECQSFREHFTDKDPAVPLAVYVSCYCKTL